MIDSLEEKLKGKLPVNREELLEIVSSWGRKGSFRTNEDILIEKCKPNECYDLSNLDVIEIENLSYIFRESLYNGNLSKWNVSSCTNMEKMFFWAEFNNDSLNNWDISKCENMERMFYFSNFDGDLSKWQINKHSNCYCIFANNKKFEKKYNVGKEIPFFSIKFIEWFEANKKTFSNLNVSKEEELDMEDYLISFNKDINEIK